MTKTAKKMKTAKGSTVKKTKTLEAKDKTVETTAQKKTRSKRNTVTAKRKLMRIVQRQFSEWS